METELPRIHTESLPLALVTSNPRKIDQFRKYPGAVDRTVTKAPLFDEEEIKQNVSSAPEQGTDYVAEISRNKLLKQRELAREQEGTFSDYTIIVSDSVLMAAKGEDSYVAVNRDGLTDEEKQEVKELINERGEVIYVGAVTFGRKMGESAFTVLTYLKIPLKEPLKEFPFSIESIPDLTDKEKGLEAGFISYEVSEEDNTLQPAFRPVRYKEEDFASVRPYISGLTKEVIELADTSTQFDKKFAPEIESSIADHPFNTLTFHAQPQDYTFMYRDYKQFFKTYGGNCSLFTLNLVDTLRREGYEPQIIIYPSNTTGYEKGHSGLIVETDTMRFLIDPGLTVPYPVPITPHIPLYPFKLGEKLFITEVRDFNGDLIPDFVLMKKGKMDILLGQKLETPDEFKQELPEILTELHSRRQVLKVDVHDRTGSKKIGISVNLKTSLVTIDEHGHRTAIPFSDLLNDEGRAYVQKIFADNGGTFNLSEQLVHIILMQATQES